MLADDRRMADRAMKSCDRVLNALAILDDDPQRFAVLINALTADQTEWRQRYDDNRRAIVIMSDGTVLKKIFK